MNMISGIEAEPNKEKCTFLSTGKKVSDDSGDYFKCEDCPLKSGVSYICKTCIESCHSGHTFTGPYDDCNFYCDCGAGALLTKLPCGTKPSE